MNDYPVGSCITSEVTLRVPSDEFPTIQSACDWSASRSIGTGGLVTVQLLDGEHVERNIRVMVQDWQRFRIVGNPTNPRRCGIKVDPSDNGYGFICANGYGIGWLDGVTIYGFGFDHGWVSEGVWSEQCYGAGVFAEGAGASVICGPNVIVEYLYYGFRSKFGAHIHCVGTQANHCGDCCYHAYAATMMASNSSASYARHTNGENLGFGFCAEAGGHIECEMSNAEGCQVAGFYSLGNASMWAHGCESHGNIGHGFYALNGGYLEANGHAALRYSNAFDNGGAGYYALNGGIMQTSMSWADRNGGGNYITSNQGLLIS